MTQVDAVSSTKNNQPLGSIHMGYFWWVEIDKKKQAVGLHEAMHLHAGPVIIKLHVIWPQKPQALLLIGQCQ